MSLAYNYDVEAACQYKHSDVHTVLDSLHHISVNISVKWVFHNIYIELEIPHYDLRSAQGVEKLTCCQDWSQLGYDNSLSSP